mgnify:CR=1 FL=1
MKKNHGTVSNICYALKLIRTCSPHYLLWDIVYGILLGIWGSAAVVFTQIFYNALFSRNSSDHRNYADTDGFVSILVTMVHKRVQTEDARPPAVRRKQNPV